MQGFAQKNAPEDAFWGIQHSAVSIQRERKRLLMLFRSILLQQIHIDQ